MKYKFCNNFKDNRWKIDTFKNKTTKEIKSGKPTPNSFYWKCNPSQIAFEVDFCKQFSASTFNNCRIKHEPWINKKGALEFSSFQPDL